MNEKEALEYLNHDNDKGFFKDPTHWKAEGYLEAILHAKSYSSHLEALLKERKEEIDRLKAQLEIAIKALRYCNVDRNLLAPHNNRHEAAAYNALVEIEALAQHAKREQGKY